MKKELMIKNKQISNNSAKPKFPGGIYGLTAEKFSQGRNNIEVVKQMIDGGVSIVQYREKHARKDFAEMYEECLKIRKMTAEHGILFIVNDYIGLAIMVGADGVHIGQNDYPVSAVKKILPDNMLLGLSTHSPEQARQGVQAGVDYIGVGPIFSTNTKENVCDAVGLEYLEWVEENIALPYVAIGGIKEHNIEKVVAKGAKTIALVTEIVSAPAISNKIKNLKKSL